MDTEAKLQYFYDSTISALNAKNQREVEVMKETLDGELERFKATHDQEITTQERLQKDAVRRELSKSLAGEKLAVRRELSRKEAEIKDRLFEEVGEVLDRHRATPEYKETLKSMIMWILDFAGDDQVIIYLCSSDAAYKEVLEKECGVPLIVSDVHFNGGIQAEIPSRNIFINDSFSSRMEEEKAACQISALME